MTTMTVFFALLLFAAAGLHYLYLVAIRPLKGRLDGLEKELSQVRIMALQTAKRESDLASQLDFPQADDGIDYGGEAIAFGSGGGDNALRDTVDPLDGPDIWEDIEALRANVRQRRAEEVESATSVHGKKLRRVQP